MTQPIRLSLPLPPSDNDIYERRLGFTKKGKPYRATRLTADAQEFRVRVHQAVMAQTTAEQVAGLSGKCMTCVWLRFPDNGRVHDSLNCMKALFDALKHALGVDDERLQWSGQWTRHEEGDPGVTVLIVEVGDGR